MSAPAMWRSPSCRTARRPRSGSWSSRGRLGGANLAQATIDTSGVWAMGGLVEIEATDAQGSSGSDEVQSVTLSNATGGTFRLAFEGYVTAPLAYNATAAQVEAALEALGSVDNVTVTGNAGGPWTVTFGGTQSGTDVSRWMATCRPPPPERLMRTLQLHLRCGRSAHGRFGSRQQLCDQL